MRLTFLLAIIVPFLFFSAETAAQNDRFAVGGQQAGAGFTTQTQSDAFSVFNNQAGLADIEGFAAAVYAENHFLISEINLFGLCAAYNTKSGTFGLGIQRYGNSTYNENRIKLAYGRKLFENFNIGAEFELGTLQIEEYGSKMTLTFGLAMQYQLSETLKVGAQLYNPLRIQVSDNEADQMPTVLTIGVSYEPSEKVALRVDVQKNLDYPLSVRAGIDYRLVEMMSLRVGYLSNPIMATMGIGLHFKQFNIDIAGSWHPSLGYAPHIGFQYLNDEPNSINQL